MATDRGLNNCGRHYADNYFWYSDSPARPPSGGDCQECQYMGWITNCAAMGSTPDCKNDYYGHKYLDRGTVPGTDDGLAFNHYFSPCLATKRNWCARDWAKTMDDDQKLKCCVNANHSRGGLFDYFRDCDPEWAGPGCTRATPSANCQTFLPERCAKTWHPLGYGDYADWEPPSADPSDPRGKCLLFVQGTQDAATRARVLDAAVGGFFAEEGVRGFGAQPRDAAQLSRILDLCGANPGSCDPALTRACEPETRESLKAAYNVLRDPSIPDDSAAFLNSLNKIKACGCHLPRAEYDKFTEVIGKRCLVDGEEVDTNPVPCDPLCMLSGAISPVKDPAAQTCCSTNCYIDDVTITLLNSAPDAINFLQACPAAANGQLSNCYFGDIEILGDVGDTSINFHQECDQCFVYDPDAPGEPVRVDCPRGLALERPGGAIGGFVQRNFGLFLGLGLVAVVAILALVGKYAAKGAPRRRE